MYIYIHAHTHIYTHIHALIHMYIHTAASSFPIILRAPPQKRQSISRTHAYTHTHTYIHIQLPPASPSSRGLPLSSVNRSPAVQNRQRRGGGLSPSVTFGTPATSPGNIKTLPTPSPNMAAANMSSVLSETQNQTQTPNQNQSMDENVDAMGTPGRLNSTATATRDAPQRLVSNYIDVSTTEKSRVSMMNSPTQTQAQTQTQTQAQIPLRSATLTPKHASREVNPAA